jgi:ADP-heptose:LPS heptosyltransferase
MSFNLPSLFLPKHSMRLQDVHRIALICYGGLGDVLLFTPVIQEIRRWVSDVHITLYVEERSAGVASVLEGVDVVLSMPVGKGSKFDFFKFLVKDLKFRHFDVVLSTGRNPFIAVALALSGIPFRIGYASTPWASALLSRSVQAKTHVYASEMHYELAHQFLRSFCYGTYQKSQAVLRPYAKAPDAKSLALGESLKIDTIASHRKHILIHPGVSLMSQSKGIYKGWSAFQWATFILNLTKDHAVYLIGGKDDAVIVEAIMAQLPEGLGHFKNLVGQTASFSDLAGVMSVMDVV